MDDKIQLVRSGDSKRPSESNEWALRRAAVIFLLFLLLVLSAVNSGCDSLHDASPPAKKVLEALSNKTSALSWRIDHIWYDVSADAVLGDYKFFPNTLAGYPIHLPTPAMPNDFKAVV